MVKNPPANVGHVSLEDPQYVSKFGKVSSGHRTGKGQFSFQSPKRAMPKNGQTAAQSQTALITPENLENSEVDTGLEKVSFHFNPKERQCQRMLKLWRYCAHSTW